MINVTLEAMTSGIVGQSVEELMSTAARTCYEGKKPESRKVIDLDGRIFATGHHTVLQHISASFHIEGISVGDITFGLHLANVFYDSSQRSGRFCSEMFSHPDLDQITDYIKHFYGVDKECEKGIRAYLGLSLNAYKERLPAVERIATQQIDHERPKATKKYIEINAPKIAQEQMRSFVPVIFPTAVAFTTNLSALMALYRSAWNPVLKEVARAMVDEILKKAPGLSFIFPEGGTKEFAIEIADGADIKYDPTVRAIDARGIEGIEIPNYEDLHPCDLLPFHPCYMHNNVVNIITEIEISTATMGQDQRHRTVRRSLPVLTGNFFLPPILAILGLEEETKMVMRLWKELIPILHPHLAVTLAPYGAMVKYTKSASLNVFLHEQFKRGCWCAQQEIYEVSRTFSALPPPCVLGKGCGEGTRCCGRDIEEAKKNPFPRRTV